MADAGQVRAADARATAPLPRVTVVVPVYNGMPYVAACLEALFGQTYPSTCYDVILVDDGSTDGTGEAARDLAQSRGWDARFQVITQANGGPASARNAGIRAATGDIVAFTDADCVADAEWLSSLVDALAAGDDAAVGVGGPVYNRTAARTWVAAYLDASRFYRHRSRVGWVEYLVTASVAFHRNALLSVGGFCEGVWGEDADLCFRLCAQGYRLLLTERGGVTHNGAPISLHAFIRELFRYGYGNAILSRRWRNGRTPPVELARHGAAVLLAPALAFPLVSSLGVIRAAGCIPLIALGHAAFCVGLAAAIVRQGVGGGAHDVRPGLGERHHAGA